MSTLIQKLAAAIREEERTGSPTAREALERQIQKKAAKPSWSVWWRNPDKKGAWDLYQKGLSRVRADKLASSVTYVLSPRWGYANVPTKVLPDGDVPMTTLIQKLAAAIREEERTGSPASRKARQALERAIDQAGSGSDVPAKHGRRIAREDARMPKEMRDALSPSTTVGAPPSHFTSPKGRTFTVGKRSVEETAWGQRETYPISYQGTPAGELWRDAFTYGPGIDGKGKWSASASKLFWTHTGSGSGLKNGGYDVVASDTAESCLRQWGHSADQILDFHAAQSGGETYSGGDIARMHDDLANRHEATVKGIHFKIEQIPGSKRVQHGPMAGRGYDRFDLFANGRKIYSGEAVDIQPLNIAGGSIEGFVLQALADANIKREPQ